MYDLSEFHLLRSYFALYTVKDKAVNGSLDFIGHRHDLEHAVVWMKDGKVTHIGGYTWRTN